MLQNRKTYALVGNWHYVPGPRGYSVFRYEPENGEMELLETVLEDVAAGQQCIDAEKGIAYVVNEIGDIRGQVGGGGYILALKIDAETGHPVVLNEKKSLSPAPSYFCLDRSKQFGIAVHHSGFGHVTKIRRDAKGRFDSVTEFDDAAVVLFRICEDGRLGEVCDVYIARGDGPSGSHMLSHLHSVVREPAGEVFLVCDKGLDKIFSFKIDREKGKLVLLNEFNIEAGCCPRYGAFHPALPIFYSNNEKCPDIFTFRCDQETGELTRLAVTGMQSAENAGKPSEASDIAVHPNGKYLYVSDRGTDMICIFDIDEDGGLHLRENIPSGGKNPRGFSFSPDERFFVVANSDTASLAVFRIGEDGSLELKSSEIPAVCPANIRFVQF